jgi:hypothetical protein
MTKRIKKPPVDETIEVKHFEDGNWWAFYIEPTRRMRKSFRRASRGYLAIPGLVDLDTADEDAVKDFLRAHPTEIDMDALEDAYLVSGTVSWSWPDEPIGEAIDDRTDRYVVPVLQRMKSLYTENDEEDVSGNEAGTSPSGPQAMDPQSES